MTNVVAPAETEANHSIQMQSCLNCVPLIDIKRQKEVLQQILIDVIAFRGVGIIGSDGRKFVGASAKAPQSAEPYTATPTSSCSTTENH